MAVLVTGAKGFIGSHLCQELVQKKYEVREHHRSTPDIVDSGDNNIFFSDLTSKYSNWDLLLDGVTCVIHCAGRAHVIEDKTHNSRDLFWHSNVLTTSYLAQKAVEYNVGRFIFLSSIGVLGSNTIGRSPFNHLDKPAPTELYSESKLEAEIQLQKIMLESSMEVVILRPPLVYGPGMKGNFARLAKLLHVGVPLPLSRVRNSRSFVAVSNLVDLILKCVDHPSAPGNSFLVSDKSDVSTPELIRKICFVTGRRDRMFPVPFHLLRLLGIVTRKSADIEKITASLQVDIEHTCNVLEWTPVVNMVQELEKTFAFSNHDS